MVDSLLAELAGHAIQLRLDGDALRYTAPPGALTADLRARLQAAKPAIVDRLRRADKPPLPASRAQKRFWDLQRLDPAWPFYNVPFLFELRGPLDPALLRRALDTIVARHESLRTTLHEHDGGLIQRVAGEGAADWLEADRRGAPDSEVRALLRQDMARPFDFTSDPALRAALVRTEDDVWLFQICLHNVVFDLASILVILEETSAHYAALAGGRDAGLPAPVQYEAYVHWQAARLATGLERRRSYWRDWFAKGQPPPWSWPPPGEPSAEAGFESLPTWTRLSAADNARLQAFCRARGVTVYIAVLTAWLLAARELSGCADLTAGTTYSDRDDRRFASMIGASILVPALRVDMTGDPALPDLLARVREVVAAALTHQDQPLEEILPDAPKGPLFKMVCTMFPDTPHGRLRLPGIEARWVETWLNPVSRPTLYLVIWETPGPGGMGLTCHMMHRRDVWDATTAARMVETFDTILRAMVPST